jgi:hypothetical protein
MHDASVRALARGAAHEVAAACAARGGSWRGRGATLAVGTSHGQNGAQAHACKPATRWAMPVYAGVALGRI